MSVCPSASVGLAYTDAAAVAVVVIDVMLNS